MNKQTVLKTIRSRRQKDIMLMNPSNQSQADILIIEEKDPAFADSLASISNPSSNEETLLLLTDLFNKKFPMQRDHGRKVAKLSLNLACCREVGYDLGKVEALRYAANLHDIGELEINSAIIEKTTPLTKAEHRIISNHAVKGYRLVRSLNFDPLVAQAILHHHENWDGSGYPGGLRDQAIPLASQIIRLAEMYVSLVSQRSFRPAYNQAEACEILTKNKRYFNPLLLGIFLERVVAPNPC